MFFGHSGSSPFNSAQSAPKEVSTGPKEEPSTLFQRQRVDMLLAELVRQFPLPVIPTTSSQVSKLTRYIIKKNIFLNIINCSKLQNCNPFVI